MEEVRSDWMWVTTLSQQRAPTGAVVDIGHDRWSIENQGSNELVNRWHADHVYKHHPTAMLVFLLVAMLCLNVFTAFYLRNLKPAARRAASMLHVGRLIAAELHAGVARRTGAHAHLTRSAVAVPSHRRRHHLGMPETPPPTSVTVGNPPARISSAPHSSANPWPTTSRCQSCGIADPGGG